MDVLDYCMENSFVFKSRQIRSILSHAQEDEDYRIKLVNKTYEEINKYLKHQPKKKTLKQKKITKKKKTHIHQPDRILISNMYIAN